MKHPFALLLFIAAQIANWVALPNPAFSANMLRPAVSKPCTTSESWAWPASLTPESIDDFKKFLAGEIKPVAGFAEGLALRRSLQGNEARSFGEYWIARALFEGKLYHVAWNGFISIASRPVESTSFAALGCLLEIHSRFPSLSLPAEVVDRLGEYQTAAFTGDEKETLWLALGTHLRTLISREGPSKNFAPEAEQILTALKGSGPHETLAKMIWTARTGDHKNSIREAEKFLFYKSLPEKLSRFVDTAHILLARALYGAGQYEKSILQWKAVSKSSNELARTLSELSWAQLMAERYTEAIGSAMNLQQGSIRTTFAPESPMVMAMAMNELCQYPQSIYAIRMFQRFYASEYRWLNEWSKKPTALYPLAIQYLKKKLKGPERIASEWVRSPLFLSHQDEINLLFDERESSTQLAKTGASEEKKMAQNILQFIRDLKPRYQVARMKLKQGDSLPQEILTDLTKLRSLVSHYRNIQAAAPIWSVIMKNHVKMAPAREAKLVAAINKDLEYRTDRMLVQLDEIAENLELIEVEIYNGASHDIIWQNAHPDYKQVMQQIQQSKDERKGGGPEVASLDWGKSDANEEGGEIWEDELGSFRANLFDNCSSKDKYLALKMRKARGDQ